MSIVGQGAREAFKNQVIEVIDRNIKFQETQTRGDRREIVRVVTALKNLREEIEQIDTA